MKRLQYAAEGQEDQVTEVPVETPPADVAAEPAPTEEPVQSDVEDEEDVEAALVADQEADDNFEIQESNTAALEALSMYASNAAYLIESNTCSMETLDLLNFGVEQQLNRIGETMPKISLESDTTIVQQHQAALEGIRDVWKRVAQAHILNFKHAYMIPTEFIMSNQSLISSYEKKLNAAELEFKNDKGDYKQSKHTGSLVELWYHFATDKGQTSDVTTAVAKDVELSKYILNTYPTELVKHMEKVVAILKGGNFKDLKSAVAVAKRLEALTHPADLFNKAYLAEGKPYLSVTGLEMAQGTLRNAISIGNVNLTKLAALATPRTVVESGSGKHFARKVGLYAIKSSANALSPVASTAAMASAGATIELSTEEIGSLFKAGHQYLANVRGYFEIYQKLVVACQAWVKANEEIIKTLPEDMEGDEVNQIQQVLKQIEQFSDNITFCFRKPAAQEVARSLKGCKYVRYLGLRMLSNAK